MKNNNKRTPRFKVIETDPAKLKNSRAACAIGGELLHPSETRVTKYDVHVHLAEDQSMDGELPGGRYFYVTNDNLDTIKRAIAHSTLEDFNPYVNNKDYVIHMVPAPISGQEIDMVMEMLRKDNDPCNFFATMKKCRCPECGGHA